MAPQNFLTSSSIVFLFFSFSSLYCICHAPYSPSSEKLPSIHFLKNLKETQKGDTEEGLSELKKYLANLGYIDQKSSTAPLHKSDEFFDDTLESAIKKYQQFYNLEITGILDHETEDLLSRPRCGVPDFHSHVNHSSFLHNVTNMGTFYTFLGGKWPPGKRLLYFSYPNGNTHVGDNFHVHVVRSMFRWQQVTRFQFFYKNDFLKADVKISFQRRDHGDGRPFDGPGGVLAHAFAPTDGRIHFDADESWETDAQRGDHDFQSVALHELGHILGLGHSPDPKAVMYATLGHGVKKRELTDDDIQGIHALYPE